MSLKISNADDTSKVRSKLNDAVDGLYEAFAERTLASSALNLCTQCCTSQQHIDRLRDTPRRDLASRDMFGYYSSVNYGPEVEAEIAYFLPRIMELVAQGTDVSNNGLDGLFVGCTRNGLPDLSDDEERAFLNFLATVLHSTLMSRPIGEWYHQPWEVMSMYVASGIGIEPALHALLTPPKEACQEIVAGAYEDMIDLVLPDEGSAPTLNKYSMYVDFSQFRPQLLSAIKSDQVFSVVSDIALSDEVEHWRTTSALNSQFKLIQLAERKLS